MQLPAIMEDKLGDVSDFMAAIERFTEAIQLNRSNYQLWSQRSAALARVGKYQEALEDARRCHTEMLNQSGSMCVDQPE